MFRSKIIGLGMYVPDNVVTNKDLTKVMDTSDEWILERTGIKERRHILKGDGNTTALMGVKAAKIAIERANLDKDEIDLILFATLSPDYYFPGSGVLVQKELKIKTCPAMDIRNQCSGFIYALSTADQFIKTGMYKNILVIGSENHSGGLDFSTRGRGVTVIFGDGAGAAIVSRSNDPNEGILSTHLHSQGEFAEELSLIGPSTNRWVPEIIEANNPEDTSYFPFMNGQLVFKNAIVRFSQVIEEGLKENKLTNEQIDLLVPHQANTRIISAMAKKLDMSMNRVVITVDQHGNTSAASIPLALDVAINDGRIKSNDKLLLPAFGGGFTWGSVLLQY